ncbi:MAG: hypothetical protein K0S70_5109 [Microbacterium sp.]|nr:hypothetical protein [Microbacterium sp.]
MPPRCTAAVTWHTFFSYVASGPPAHRLEEIGALADAGIVRFLGPEIAVRIDDGRFVASSPRVPGEVRAGALVDAWLPSAEAAASDNAALRELATRHGREVHVADETFTGSLGRIDTDADGRVVSRDGIPHATLFAIGTRPRSNALSLRHTDRVAGAVSEAVAAVSARRWAFSR